MELQEKVTNKRQLIIIGTLHAGLAPHAELQSVLEQYRPDQLLVEIAQEDLTNKSFSTYPDEMVFAQEWAIKNKVPVHGFDAKISVLAEGKTEKDNQKAIQEAKQLMKSYTWKDMNVSEIQAKLETKRAKSLIDPIKNLKREQTMLKNIEDALIGVGTVVVVTGTGHLDFLKRICLMLSFRLGREAVN